MNTDKTAEDLCQEKFLSANRGNRVVSQNPARLWQILGKSLPVNISSFAKAFWDEVGLVNQSLRRQQVLKVILWFVVINSNTTVPSLVIRQVIRILQHSAGGKKRVENGCFSGKNSHYVKDHLAAVNNSAQHPQVLLLSGCGENQPLKATFKFSPGFSGKSTCLQLKENTFLFVCFPSQSQ